MPIKQLHCFGQHTRLDRMSLDRHVTLKETPLSVVVKDQWLFEFFRFNWHCQWIHLIQLNLQKQ